MARPKGFRNKEKKDFIKVDNKDGTGDFLIHNEEGGQEIADELLKDSELVEVVEPVKIQVEDDPRLPNKSLFRPDEAADYFGYGPSTIYTWIQHGILKAEKYEGTYRISRESILACRFKGRFDPLV